MKIFANKSMWKKIVIIFLLIISISFVAPKPAQASVGGELMKPVCDLLVGLGDGVIKIIHIGILGQDNTLLRIYEGGMGSFISTVLKVAAIAVCFIAIVVAVSIIGPIIAGASGISAILASGGTIMFTVAKTAGVTILAGVLFFASDIFANQVVLPLYTISPEEIFRNKIPIFDVNFVNPNSNPINSKWADEISVEKKSYTSENTSSALSSESDIDKINKKLATIGIEDIATFMKGAEVKTLPDDGLNGANAETKEYTREINGINYTLTVQTTAEGEKITLSPDISIESSSSSNNIDSSADGEENKLFGISFLLQDTIAKWYYNLRIIAIVGMMSVLVYIGIRITISSASEQKAKYKELLKDWFVGMVLLFSMHYIMNFSNVAVYRLTEMFNSLNPYQMVPIIEDNINGTSGKILSTLEEYDVPKEIDGKVLWANGEGENSKYVEWHTNLMGAIRMKAEARKEDGNDESFIGYSLMFVVMVIYTISFCWIYLKRVVYMAFLTLIAPLVALTYPIDKVNDGHAQGFNYWFKEYIFNLLIQPVHLLIYTILVSSAAELAIKHWIYSLVVLGFLVSAEKILRKMFNFRAENAPGLMSGPIAAGLTMTGMRWLLGHGPNNSQNKNKSNGEKGSIGGVGKTKMSLFTDSDSLTETGGSQNIIPGAIIESDGEEGSITSGVVNGNNKGIAHKVSKGGSTSTNRKIRRAKLMPPQLVRGSTADSSSAAVRKKEQNNQQSVFNRKKGLENAANRFLSNRRNKILQDAREGKTLKNIGKGVAGAFGAATLGTLGLAAGVASGDSSKAFQNAAIGAAGGFKLASGMGSSIAEKVDLDGMADAYGRGAMGSENYDRREANKYAAEYASNSDIVRQVMENFDISSWKDAEKKAQELANYYGVEEGYYDVKEWKYLEKMKEQMIKKHNISPEGNTARKYAVAAKKTYDNFYDAKKSKSEIEKAMVDTMGIRNSKQLRMMSDSMFDYARIVN